MSCLLPTQSVTIIRWRAYKRKLRHRNGAYEVFLASSRIARLGVGATRRLPLAPSGTNPKVGITIYERVGARREERFSVENRPLPTVLRSA